MSYDYIDDESLVEGEIHDWPLGAPDDVSYIPPDNVSGDGRLAEAAEWPPIRLPRAPKEPVIGRLESFDREHVICEHELARALESLLTNEPVRLFNTEIEFERIAQRVMDIVHDQRCPLKGA